MKTPGARASIAHREWTLDVAPDGALVLRLSGRWLMHLLGGAVIGAVPGSEPGAPELPTVPTQLEQYQARLDRMSVHPPPVRPCTSAHRGATVHTDVRKSTSDLSLESLHRRFRHLRRCGGLGSLDALSDVVSIGGLGWPASMPSFSPPASGSTAPPVRAKVCEHAAWLGIRLDPVANVGGGPRISTADSPVSAWVIPTNEELMIARRTLACALRP